MKCVRLALSVFLLLFFLPCEAFATNDSVKDSTKCYSRFDSLFKREVYFLADTMPQFPGGMKAMMTFISRNLSYRSSGCMDMEGTVFIIFIVERDGTLSDKHILKGVSDLLNKEALDVIDKMPLWRPGFCNGTSVPVRFNIPVRFRFH